MNSAIPVQSHFMGLFRTHMIVGLLAQLVEHCTGIAEVMGSNPVQAWISFRPYFHYCSSSVHYCEDLFDIHAFIRSSNIWLSYIRLLLLLLVLLLVLLLLLLIIINYYQYHHYHYCYHYYHHHPWSFNLKRSLELASPPGL